jgi:ATP-dependent Lhr-like helicase
MASWPASGSSTAPPGRESSAFGLLDERLRRWVWEQGWTELRDVQEAAIPLILAGAADVIVAAATATGKTEAAFLPILSRLVRDGADAGGVRVLCVSPLKALINDQFDRLDELCARVEIPVHRWHGDVSSAAKGRLLRDPDGVLLITPESLEAHFVLRGHSVPRLFAALDYVVVDELHAFIGAERGRQVQSLLHRLETAIGRRVPRIGLSATLGDMSLAAGFLRPRDAGAVRVLVSGEGGQELRLQVRGYRTGGQEGDGGAADGGDDAEDEEDDTAADDASVAAICDHLFATLRGRHNLVFANRRAEVEQYADRLRRRCEALRAPNEFFPHHGSLSRELRTDVEALLKDPSRPVSVVCTTTLELGIDIGDMASIAQIGPPPSVAGMRQRLGRSGRRGGPAVMRIYIQEPPLTAESPLPDALRTALVQTVAMVELLVAGWYEPPPAEALHLSTLVQQLLSLIAERHGVWPAAAWRLLCESGPFAGVDQAMFAALLRGLGGHDLLVQSVDGTLLLGAAGERLVNHYGFYTAFVTPEEYRVVHEGRTLGALPFRYPLTEGTLIVFAGRRWRVTAVDAPRHTVTVVPAAGGRPPRFSGAAALVHDRVRAEMLRVYTGREAPVYLDATAHALLEEARGTFRRLELAERRLLESGRDTLLFPWTGDRATGTLALQLRARGLPVATFGPIVEVAGMPAGEVRRHLEALRAAGPADARTLAAAVAAKRVEKHDGFLPDELLCAGYASRDLDAEGAWRAVVGLLEG